MVAFLFVPLIHPDCMKEFAFPGAFMVNVDGFSTDCPSHFIFTYKRNLLGDGMMLHNSNSALHL